MKKINRSKIMINTLKEMGGVYIYERGMSAHKFNDMFNFIIDEIEKQFAKGEKDEI